MLKDVKVYIPMGHDQRVIIKFLFNEQCHANENVERLEAQFHEDAYSLRSVQFWIGEIKVPLDENYFGSAPSIMKTLQVSHSTVLKHLHENHNVVWLQHPPYSPDLPPSDFYFFPTVKEKLKDIEMADEEDLFYRLQKLLNDIPICELRKVFTAWIKRLVEVNQGNESYIS